MILLVFFFASGGHTRSFLNEAEGGERRKTVERKRNQKPLGLPPLLAAAERSRHIAGRKDVPPQPQCAQPYHSRPGCGRVRAKGPRTRGRIRIESRDSRGGRIHGRYANRTGQPSALRTIGCEAQRRRHTGQTWQPHGGAPAAGPRNRVRACGQFLRGGNGQSAATPICVRLRLGAQSAPRLFSCPTQD